MKELITFSAVMLAIFIWSAAVFNADAQYYTDYGDTINQQLQQQQQQMRQMQMQQQEYQNQQRQLELNRQFSNGGRMMGNYEYHQ